MDDVCKVTLALAIQRQLRLCSGVYVVFRGTDNHLLRTGVPDIVSTATGNGRGVQFEAILAHSLNMDREHLPPAA
jgi:hypothetical protein